MFKQKNEMEKKLVSFHISNRNLKLLASTVDVECVVVDYQNKFAVYKSKYLIFATDFVISYILFIIFHFQMHETNFYPPEKKITKQKYKSVDLLSV